MAITNTLYEHRMSVLFEELYKAHKATKAAVYVRERDQCIARRDALIDTYLIMSGDDPDNRDSEESLYERLDELWMERPLI